MADMADMYDALAGSLDNAVHSSSHTSLPTYKPITTQTAALRAKLAKFIRAQHAFYQTLPRAKTGLLATSEVLEEVVHTATAFHCNETGGLDILWLKKDMPREALKKAEAGYWLSTAGPGPQNEIRSHARVHRVPPTVIDTIQSTNSHTLISDFLYPFVDFWNLCLYHLLIWIACAFLCGTLAILQPVVIVGESSKILSLFMKHIPGNMHAPVDNATFERFLNGNFTMADLLNLFVENLLDDDWEELPLYAPDYLQALGIPIIVYFGHLAGQCAIYIPKCDPYRPYHSQRIATQIEEVDYWCRLMAKLALKIVHEAQPIPTGLQREAALVRIRAVIVEQAVQQGIWQGLASSKLELSQAQFAFGSAKQQPSAHDAAVSNSRSYGERNKAAAAARDRNFVKTVGEPSSDERRDWVIFVINNLRILVEQGRSFGLLPCPRQWLHGSIEHTIWLFTGPKKGVAVLPSVLGFERLQSPKTQLDIVKRDIRQDHISDLCYKTNTLTRSPAEALAFLATAKGKFTGEAVNRYLQFNTCPHCSSSWITADRNNSAAHTCMVIRRLFLPEVLQQETARRLILEETKDAAAEDNEHLENDITRTQYTTAYPWSIGERLNTDNPIWQVKAEAKKARATRSVALNRPLYERAMDRLGRLYARSLNYKTMRYPFQLLQACDAVESIKKDSNLQSTPAVTFHSLATFYPENKEVIDSKIAGKSGSLSSTLKAQIDAVLADEDRYLVSLDAEDSSNGEEQHKWLLAQAVAALKQDTMSEYRTTITLADIRTAYTQRISMNLLRPTDFDYDAKIDLLEQAFAGQASTSESSNILHVATSALSVSGPSSTHQAMDTDDTTASVADDALLVPHLPDSTTKPILDSGGANAVSTEVSPPTAVAGSSGKPASKSTLSDRAGQSSKSLPSSRGPSIRDLLSSGLAAKDAPRLSTGLKKSAN